MYCSQKLVSIFSIVSLVFLNYCKANYSISEDFYMDEVRSLSEMPLKKLIKIKSTFARKSDLDRDSDARQSSAVSFPLAAPLRRVNPSSPIKRYEEWDDGGKDSKISKIFQLTITTLSFLAFGGYLITLIITAIKRKQNNEMMMMNPANVIFLSSLKKLKRPKRRIVIHDPAENNFSTDQLYTGMIMLSSDFSRNYY
ncbi:hypothetical protein QAD02_008663 [Eretmocerus hayati]|uniref:Uncharacterized protein n=1 Tax=Eretmocerus hayati TaxID=131215 RepID=A0ACC2N8H8_9HYME|nr:hypothetical protein QAD02_008663 [Eretmocerus hayati]